METTATIIEELYEQGQTFSKTTIELAKLKGLETTTIVVTALIWRLSVVIVLALFGLVLNIGIALMLGEWLGKSYYGFFIVAGFYLLSAIVLHFFMHNWIKKPVSDLIITQALQ
jgi:fatty acid desaturase